MRDSAFQKKPAYGKIINLSGGGANIADAAP